MIPMLNSTVSIEMIGMAMSRLPGMRNRKNSARMPAGGEFSEMSSNELKNECSKTNDAKIPTMLTKAKTYSRAM